MLSMAPVASPTASIWQTMGGKTLLSMSGSAIVRPLAMLARADDGALDDLVAGGAGGDRERVQDGHARRDERAERAGEAGDGRLADELAEDEHLEQRRVDPELAALGLVRVAQRHERDDRHRAE